jgi:hypothetical protein
MIFGFVQSLGHVPLSRTIYITMQIIPLFFL